MTATAYPLTWPPQFPRTKYRESGKFKTELPAAIKNVQASLNGFSRDSGKTLKNLVISSNVSLGESKPTDPGVAVWFEWDGLQVCIPVDRYLTVASNLQAIHYIVEARRVELRHGTLALVRATFTGFLSLPAPAGKRTWHRVYLFRKPKGEAGEMEAGKESRVSILGLAQRDCVVPGRCDIDKRVSMPAAGADEEAAGVVHFRGDGAEQSREFAAAAGPHGGDGTTGLRRNFDGGKDAR